MNFFQRFKRYLIGVAIGIILTGVFFKERLSVFTAWLPANVVKNTIKDNNLYLSDKASCQFQAYQLETDDIESLLDDGKVVFSESQIKEKPYEYIIKSKDREYSYLIRMAKDLKNDSMMIMNISGPVALTKCD